MPPHPLCACLHQIRANSGISLTSHTTPPLPAFMPPLTLLLPWIIEACSLPTSYSKGREVAYQLLCDMMITHWHTAPPLQHTAHFYHLLHAALQPSSVSSCGGTESAVNYSPCVHRICVGWQ